MSGVSHGSLHQFLNHVGSTTASLSEERNKFSGSRLEFPDCIPAANPTLLDDSWMTCMDSLYSIGIPDRSVDRTIARGTHDLGSLSVEAFATPAREAFVEAISTVPVSTITTDERCTVA